MKGTIRNWMPADDARLRTLVREGATTREIADALDRTPEAVQQRKSRIGIAQKQQPLPLLGPTRLETATASEVEAVRALVHAKATSPEDAALLLDALGVAS